MTLVEIYAVLYAFGIFTYFMWLHRIIGKAEKNLFSNARNVFGFPYVLLRYFVTFLFSVAWPWLMLIELTLRVGFFFMLRSLPQGRPPNPRNSSDTDL